MATITELANAIDGFLKNRTTARDILTDQIKRATRQIRRKENNLHQDLAREQRRHYDAEAERDNEIIRKQLAEGGIDTVVDRHVRKLLQEQFALQLLYRQNAHHLQRCRADRGLLEYNRDRLYERYEKWKAKEKNSCQNILNLQGQILALQNNPPNIQQIGMVGYRFPIYYGRPGEDPEDWLRDIQRFIIASQINVAPGAGQAPGREEAFGLVVSCLAGDALNWYNTRVKSKNWRCNNLSDNLGVADLNAVQDLGAGNNANQIGGLNTAGEFQGKAAAEIGRIGAGVATGVDIIPNGTWDEDWSIAGGEPVDNAPVASNTGGGLPAVTIALGIKLGQLLYLFRTAYTTVEHLKQTAVFGQLMQGDMSVEQFSA
ncbi:hypothetical protein RclHR1_11950011 [Rhizophagus clarus]|uniref:Uncharacterized protein n=1 Tax=Rhizophagus clarus TaxID=94130 RepID=A0A2Z6Q5P6_9GLOM|nr:hypothetical protein RclHR1_11950011 [Rhizophagus clarus]